MTNSFAVFMIGSIALLFLALFVLMYQWTKHKDFLLTQDSCRLLSQEELEAIHYFDLDKPSFGFLSGNLPKTKKEKSVYCFKDKKLSIHSRHLKGNVTYYFYITEGKRSFEVLIPHYFLDHLKLNSYNSYNIETVNRASTFVLIGVEGLVSYPELHQEFMLGGNRELNSKINIDSSREANEKEEKLFLFSKWGTAWMNLFLILMPLFLLMFIDEQSLMMVISFSPLLILITFPAYISYKKRVEYIKKSNTLYTLEGLLSFDEDEYQFLIDKMPLKLSYNWVKLLKKRYQKPEKVKVEAFLHTFDTLTESRELKIQPIYIKSVESNSLNMDYKSMPIVRSFWMPMMFFLFALIMVSLMKFHNFLPYTYYGIKTYSEKSHFYSTEGMLEENLKEHQYLESFGMAIPVLSEKQYSYRSHPANYKEIETDERKIFFPKDIDRTILEYPRVSTATKNLIRTFQEFKWRSKNFVRCNQYRGDKRYFDFCMETVIYDFKKKSKILEPFKGYDTFLLKLDEESFSLLQKEVLIKLYAELYRSYEKIQSLQDEGILYCSMRVGNYQVKGFYENIAYLDYMFNYIDSFPRSKMVAGVLRTKDDLIWYVTEDNYNHLSYTTFLSLLWLFFVFMMSYTFVIFINRVWRSFK